MKPINSLLTILLFLIPVIVYPQATETRQLASFTGLQVGGSFDTFIEHGNEESVKIVAEGIDLNKVITEVKDNTLNIYLEKGNYRNIKIKLYVTYKNLQRIARSGSGNLISDADLSADNLDLTFSGSGGVNLKRKINAKQLNMNISGSGTVNIGAIETDNFNLSLSGSSGLNVASGYAKAQAIRLSGSGSIRAYGLKSETCSISVSGSGNAEVSVDKSFDGSVSGSGNVNYKGSANVISSKISGSGRINKE